MIGVVASAGIQLFHMRPREGKLAFLGKPDGEKEEMMAVALKLWLDGSWLKCRGKIAKERFEHAVDAAAAYVAWEEKIVKIVG